MNGIPLIIGKDYSTQDVIIQAQLGLGKTGTFAISMLEKIDEDLPEIQGVVILNTRELADQVHGVMRSIGANMNVNFIKCVGKTRVDGTVPFPKNGTILIGTPGKIATVLSRNIIRGQQINIKLLVIDEFDKTLEDDFIPPIQIIFKYTKPDTKIVLSSATMNEDVIRFSSTFMKESLVISVKDEEISLEGIRQFHVKCEREDDKFEVILDLYRVLVVSQAY